MIKLYSTVQYKWNSQNCNLSLSHMLVHMASPPYVSSRYRDHHLNIRKIHILSTKTCARTHTLCVTNCKSPHMVSRASASCVHHLLYVLRTAFARWDKNQIFPSRVGLIHLASNKKQGMWPQIPTEKIEKGKQTQIQHSDAATSIFLRTSSKLPTCWKK